MKSLFALWMAVAISGVPTVFPFRALSKHDGDDSVETSTRIGKRTSKHLLNEAKEPIRKNKPMLNRPVILPTTILETSFPPNKPTAPPTCKTKNEASIPKVVIQTVKSKDDSLNGDLSWSKYHSSLADKNPHFTFSVFDDEEALQFIDAHFHDTMLPHVIRNVPRPVMKADLFRLAAVSVLGGFYMDMDVVAKGSFDPIVDSGCGAVFPKEWWKDDDAFFERHFKLPEDGEDHWQVGNYAFAAVPNHPLLVDLLQEAIKRSLELISTKEKEDITDLDVLRTTGPYMLSEVYHNGRKEGKYKDVLHISGDRSKPLKKNQENRYDWHKFGPYAEHMLSHTWVLDEDELKLKGESE